MSATELEHITITTGAVRMSPRSEVGDHVVDLLRQQIASGGDLGATGWSVALLPTPTGGFVFDLSHKDIGKVARCWLCNSRETSASMWAAASSSRVDSRVRLSMPKAIPWLAASLVLATVMHIGARTNLLVEAGDLERCVAWALLE